MQDDTNLMLARPLTFFAAMRMSWFVLSAALKIAGAFLVGSLFGGVTASSTATARKNGSGAIVSVERLQITYSNVTMTWEKRHKP